MDLLTALKNRKAEGQTPIIPDIKCRSPKEGDLLRGRDPLAIAKKLEEAGACALSVVTEEKEFAGSLKLLRTICVNTTLPVLRKDFLETADDLKATKEAGASGVLLMYSCLGKERLAKLYEDAVSMGLIPLVETHSSEELRWAGELGASLIGINNRNILELERDDGDVSFAAGLLADTPQDAFIVVESSLKNAADIHLATRFGADAALVGTTILKAHDPAEMYLALNRPCSLKICGLMNIEDVNLCLRYNADMLGFVTEYPVPVPWNLSSDQTKLLLEHMREAAPSGEIVPPACIVTGGDPDIVLSLCKELRPDYIQLHYTETAKETALITRGAHELGIRVIRSVPHDEELRLKMFGTNEVSQIFGLLVDLGVDCILLDSRNADNAASGGGSILEEHTDQDLKELIAKSPIPVMLGGGLNTSNINRAVEEFSPDWIDIMTGSETEPGRKSEELLKDIRRKLCQKDDSAYMADSTSLKR